MARGFDGSASNYLSTDTVPVSANPLTISCKFNANNFTNDQTLVFLGDKDAAFERDSYSLRLLSSAHSNAKEIEFLTSDGSASDVALSGGTATSTGTWYTAIGMFQSGGTTKHVAAIRPSGVSGFPGGTTSTFPSNVDRLAIGLENTNDSQPFDGSIAEVAIWNTNLIVEEMDSLEWFSPLLVRPANLVFYAPLINGEDVDYVGGISLTENGTLTNEPHCATRRPYASYP